MPLQTDEELSKHRRALVAFCYRMTGSLHEAEDLAQETLLRAWRNRESLQGAERVRPWLYRIATNVGLDALKSTRRRELPQHLRAPSPGDEPMEAPALETAWVEPAPQSLFTDEEIGPEARYSQAQSVTLAFIAAMARLNPRQRAMVLLRDVLGWSARETAQTLETTEAAVHSGLIRAREGLVDAGFNEKTPTGASRDLITRYVRAWQERNVTDLVAMLRADAVLAMPPIPCWYRGPVDIARALAQSVLSPQNGELVIRPIHGNGTWGIAGWVKPAGALVHVPLGVQLVTEREGSVSDIICFVGADAFKAFELPLTAPV